MHYCSICNKAISEDQNLIILRNNLHVCKSCIYDTTELLNREVDRRKHRISELELWIKKPSKSKKNFISNVFLDRDMRGFLMLLILLIIVFFRLFFDEEELGFLLTIFFIGGIIVSVLKVLIDKKLRNAFKEELRKNRTELRKFELEKSEFYKKLGPYFEQIWGNPPDWEWRRWQVYNRENGNCQICGVHLTESFDVHHVVPKSEKCGDHSLDNLQLLCRTCHSEIDSRGHSLLQFSNSKKKRHYKFR